jgi:hypothetical protein
MLHASALQRHSLDQFVQSKKSFEAAPTDDALQCGTGGRSTCFAVAWVKPGQKKEGQRMLVKSLTFAAAAVALGVLAAPASAAPVSGLKDVGIDTSSAAEPVHYRYRRCCGTVATTIVVRRIGTTTMAMPPATTAPGSISLSAGIATVTGDTVTAIGDTKSPGHTTAGAHQDALDLDRRAACDRPSPLCFPESGRGFQQLIGYRYGFF